MENFTDFKMADGLSKVQLNERILHEINLLQTEGTVWNEPGDIVFNNAGIIDLITGLTELNDFLLYVCEVGSEVKLEPKTILKHCQSIRQLKEHLNELRANVPCHNKFCLTCNESLAKNIRRNYKSWFKTKGYK